MSTDTPSSRDEEIPTRRTNAVAKMIGSLAYQLKAGDLNLRGFADVAQVELDKLGQLERELIRLSAEREDLITRQKIASDLLEYDRKEIFLMKDALAERDKELAEVKVKHEVACCTITTMQEERANRESYISLQNLSSFLSAGSGDDSVSAKDYETRIRWGINEMLKVETQRREAAEAQLLAAQTVNGKLREALKRVDDLIIRRNESGIERFWDDLNGVKSFAKEALALSPDPTLLDEVKREKELIKDVEESLAAIDKAIAQLFWTSDDGSTQRDGTPEDGDAPPFITEAWKDIRSSLSRLRQSTHSGESHAD